MLKPTINCSDCAASRGCAIGRLDEAQRCLLAPHLRERALHRGDALLVEDHAAACVRVIKLGIVFAHRRGLDGRSRPIGILGRGQALGLFGMLGHPNQTSCVAQTNVRICELPMLALRELNACGSQVMVQLIRAMVENFACLATWSAALRLPGVVNQLAYVVLLLADTALTQAVELPSHAALAELLGTRRESIARALHALEREGCIRRGERKRYEVSRDRLLARFAASVP